MSPMVSADGGPRMGARAERVALMSRREALRGVGAVALGGTTLALTGCTFDGGVGIADPTRALDGLAEQYTRLALQLAKHQPSLIDAWFGTPAWSEGPRVPAPALRARAATLLSDVDRLAGHPTWNTANALVAAGARTSGPPPDFGDIADVTRVAYLRGQIRALDDAAGRLLGESQPFADQARRTLGHVPPARDATAIDALRQRLAEALPTGPGTLAGRHAAFRRSMAVPADRVEAVFAAAVAWCREAARDLLPLPEGDRLTTRVADEAGWEAFSRPAGPRASDLWVARRGSADAAHLLQLAAHEGTPGHHAQHVLATAELVEVRGWAERALVPTFGPHRLWAEGAAEAGADLLLPLETRARVCREVLLPTAGLSPAVAARLVVVERLAAELGMEVAYIAKDYLDSSLSVEVVTARLRDDALVLDPSGMMAFIEKQRAKVLAYPLGRQLVRQALDATPRTWQWARLKTLSTTLTLGE